MNERIFLLELLDDYKSENGSEELSRTVMVDFVKMNERCFENDFKLGHVTGSALIVDNDKKNVLLTHHAKLNMWVQFGGHSDGHWNPLEVARREAYEESGLTTLAYFPEDDSIFDLDIHTIPERNDMPEHNHFDVRILLSADIHEDFIVSDESHDLKWIPIDHAEEYNSDLAFLRMVGKISNLN